MISDGCLNHEQLEMLKLIRETSVHCLEMVNGLLKKEIKHPVPDKNLVNINTILTRTVKLLRHRAKEKNQEIKLIACENNCVIDINTGDINRVLDNLIDNAIKFSPLGSKIKVSTDDDSDNIQIIVADQGMGIPDNLKADLFKGQIESRRTGTAGERSLGMGLRICNQIITSYQGKLWFESKDGIGTKFIISLPKPGETRLKAQ